MKKKTHQNKFFFKLNWGCVYSCSQFLSPVHILRILNYLNIVKKLPSVSDNYFVQFLNEASHKRFFPLIFVVLRFFREAMASTKRACQPKSLVGVVTMKS